MKVENLLTSWALRRSARDPQDSCDGGSIAIVSWAKTSPCDRAGLGTGRVVRCPPMARRTCLIGMVGRVCQWCPDAWVRSRQCRSCANTDCQWTLPDPQQRVVIMGMGNNNLGRPVTRKFFPFSSGCLLVPKPHSANFVTATHATIASTDQPHRGFRQTARQSSETSQSLFQGQASLAVTKWNGCAMRSARETKY